MKKFPFYQTISLLLITLALLGLTATQATGFLKIHLPMIYGPEAGGGTNGTAVVTADGATQFQTIDGFGVNINGMSWDDGKVKPVIDQFSTTMGATLYRVIVDEEDWEATNDNSDPHVFNWDYYNTVYQQPKFRSLWQTLRYLEQKDNAQIILSMMGRTSDWMGRSSINQSQEDEWVEMIASLVVYARDNQHLQVKLLSPLNETDLGDPEGPSVDPAQYARLLKKLALRLDELGMNDVKFVTPETAYNYNMWGYIEPILADDVLMKHIAHFAFHNYGSDIYDIAQTIRNAGYPDTTFWMTEYSQWCNECSGSAEASNSWPLATQTTDWLFNFLEGGASGGLLWEGFDSYYYHHGEFQYWGVMSYNPQDGSFAPRPRFTTAAQVFRFVRPGMVRIATTSESADVRMLAFVDPTSGALTIVGKNRANQAAAIDGTLLNVHMPGSLHLSWTTSQQSLASGGSIPVNGQTFHATVPADSVFALSTIAP